MKKIIASCIASIFTAYGYSQTLQTVTDAGKVTTNEITIQGNSFTVASGATTSGGYSGLQITPYGTHTNGGYTSINSFYSGVGWVSPLVLQNHSTGRVGVGITSPDAKLHVGISNGAQFRIDYNNTGDNYYDANTHYFRGNSGVGELLTLKGASNNVGIGITNPNYTLSLNNNKTISFNNDPINPFGIEGGDNSQTRIIMGSASGAASNIAFGISNGTGSSGFSEKMRISADGNVAIGVTNSYGYKLAVAGNMIAESVKVALKGNWPDYVFNPEHKLLSLNELENYITLYQHLPEMPSALEVKKEGIDLGEMDSKLLKKIEELTLYMIDFKKEMDTIRLENQSLKTKVAQLESKK